MFGLQWIVSAYYNHWLCPSVAVACRELCFLSRNVRASSRQDPADFSAASTSYTQPNAATQEDMDLALGKWVPLAC